MSRFERWLAEESTVLQSLWHASATIAVSVAYSLLVWTLFGKVVGYHFPLSAMSADQYVLIIAGGFGEEVLFRVFPLAVVIGLFGRNAAALVGTSVLASFYFGYLHAGPTRIIVQGMLGLLLCLLYLKAGGYHKKEVRGLAFCGTVHVVYNFILIPLQILL